MEETGANTTARSAEIVFPDFGARLSSYQPKFSARERQIIEHLVRGDSNKVIARKCAITEATTKVHVKAVLRKVGVQNRTQIAVWALRNAQTSEQSDVQPPIPATVVQQKTISPQETGTATHIDPEPVDPIDKLLVLVELVEHQIEQIADIRKLDALTSCASNLIEVGLDLRVRSKIARQRLQTS